MLSGKIFNTNHGYVNALNVACRVVVVKQRVRGHGRSSGKLSIDMQWAGTSRLHSSLQSLVSIPVIDTGIVFLLSAFSVDDCTSYGRTQRTYPFYIIQNYSGTRRRTKLGAMISRQITAVLCYGVNMCHRAKGKYNSVHCLYKTLNISRSCFPRAIHPNP